MGTLLNSREILDQQKTSVRSGQDFLVGGGLLHCWTHSCADKLLEFGRKLQARAVSEGRLFV